MLQQAKWNDIFVLLDKISLYCKLQRRKIHASESSVPLYIAAWEEYMFLFSEKKMSPTGCSERKYISVLWDKKCPWDDAA